jgi:hypothetical protein
MAQEHFIRGKVDGHKHEGLRSTRRRLDASFAQLKDWRNQRTAAHELGHAEPNEPELCFKGEPLAQHEGFTPQLELDLLLPYVNHLKAEVIQERREELRERQARIDAIYRSEQDVVIPQKK